MPNVDRAAIARAFLPVETEFISERSPLILSWWFYPPPGYGFPWKLDLWDKAVDEVERISGNAPPDRSQRC